MVTATCAAPCTPETNDDDAVITAFTAGGAGVLLDSGGAVLAFPAATATTAQLHFAIQNSSGLIHAAMPSARLDQLRIPDQSRLPSEDSGTDFTVAVDANAGIGTGISAVDRAHTLRVLSDPDSVPEDLIRPGHVLPIRCRDAGHQVRARVWELALELVAAAGHSEVAVVCRLIGDDGDTLDAHNAEAFAVAHGLPVCSSRQGHSGTRRHLHVAGADDD